MKRPRPFHAVDVRSRIGRKLLLAVGLPPLLLALAGLLWLGSATHARVWGPALGFLALVAGALVAIHFFAVRALVEVPLGRMVASLKRAEEYGFLLRVPVDSDDELGELARSFNNALATITDLHVRRIEDAQSMESMQRELALKAEVEAQHALADEANRRLEHRLRELTLLADLARTLSSTLRLEELVRAVTDHLGRELGYASFALMLAVEKPGEARPALEVRSVFGIDPAALGSRVELGEGVAGTAAEERRRILVRDTRADARFVAQRWTQGQQGSLLAVPLVAGDACVGVLDFFRPTPDGFPDDEMSFLESVAGQAAMAIANARLHERTVRLSLTDALTGLHNRRSFFQRLGQELDRSERFSHPFAVAMIDVDHFQLLKDRAGHRAGDAALRRAAELVLVGGAQGRHRGPPGRRGAGGDPAPRRHRGGPRGGGEAAGAGGARPPSRAAPPCPAGASPSRWGWRPSPSTPARSTCWWTAPTPRCTPPSGAAATWRPPTRRACARSPPAGATSRPPRRWTRWRATQREVAPASLSEDPASLPLPSRERAGERVGTPVDRPSPCPLPSGARVEENWVPRRLPP